MYNKLNYRQGRVARLLKSAEYYYLDAVPSTHYTPRKRVSNALLTKVATTTVKDFLTDAGRDAVYNLRGTAGNFGTLTGVGLGALGGGLIGAGLLQKAS